MWNNSLVSKYITPLSPLPTLVNPSGKLKGEVQCIIFDIYGTLFISGSGDIGIPIKEPQQAETLEKLLIKFRITKSPRSLLNDLFSTIEAAHSASKEKGIDFPEVVIEQIWMQVLENDDLETVRAFAVEFELIANPVYPMPHLKELLAGCKDLNLLMGIISNAQFYTPYLFHWFLNSSPEDLGFHPDLTLYSFKSGHAKPSAFMFQAAVDTLKRMKVPEHATLYVGNDMLNDIYPAQKAGFQTVLFAGDTRSLRLRKDNPKCKDLAADLIITDLAHLLDVLG
jgi:putative hydrolase of the HAD superfamily